MSMESWAEKMKAWAAARPGRKLLRLSAGEGTDIVDGFETVAPDGTCWWYVTVRTAGVVIDYHHAEPWWMMKQLKCISPEEYGNYVFDNLCTRALAAADRTEAGEVLP